MNFILTNFGRVLWSEYCFFFFYLTLFNVVFFSLVTACADLSCGENEICVPAGDTYECVCHPDYEGDNCQDRSQFNFINFQYM